MNCQQADDQLGSIFVSYRFCELVDPWQWLAKNPDCLL
jgi:hypothetical protein